MKPVQLMPTSTKVKTAAPGSGSVVGAIAVGCMLALGVGGYFLFAHLESIQTQTATISASALGKEEEATGLSEQILEAGKKRDWSLTSDTYEKQVINKLDERVDYPQVARELNSILPNGCWLSTISVAAQGSLSGASVTMTGYASSMAQIASLPTRVDATETMQGADLGDITYETANNGKTYIGFSISATLEGVDLTAVPTDPTTGLPVSRVVDDKDGASELSLEPTPGYERRQKTAKAAVKPKPKPKPQLTSLEKVSAEATHLGGTQ